MLKLDGVGWGGMGWRGSAGSGESEESQQGRLDSRKVRGAGRAHKLGIWGARSMKALIFPQVPVWEWHPWGWAS